MTFSFKAGSGLGGNCSFCFYYWRPGDCDGISYFGPQKMTRIPGGNAFDRDGRAEILAAWRLASSQTRAILAAGGLSTSRVSAREPSQADKGSHQIDDENLRSAPLQPHSDDLDNGGQLAQPQADAGYDARLALIQDPRGSLPISAGHSPQRRCGR